MVSCPKSCYLIPQLHSCAQNPWKYIFSHALWAMGRRRATGKPQTVPLPAHMPAQARQKRRPQPGRQAPTNNRGSQEAGRQREGGQESGSGRPLPFTQWDERQRRLAEAWDARRAPAAARLIASLPQATKWEEELRQLEFDHLHGRLAAVAPDVIRRHTACCGGAAGVTQVQDAEVLYVGERFMAPLRVPQYACARCRATFSAEAEDIALFPFTPSQATMWAHQMVLERAKYGALVLGFSADGELSCLHQACPAATTDATAYSHCSALRDAQPLCDVLRPLYRLRHDT